MPADFSSIIIKINALKAKVEQSSITPLYLGTILEEMVAIMQLIDLSDFADDIADAIIQAQQALNTAQLAISKAETADNNATEALSKATTALFKASTAIDAANLAVQTVETITDSIAEPGGIAPLDDNGLIPSKHIPGLIDDVKDFNGFVDFAPINPKSTSKESTNPGCSIVFDTHINAFLLLYTPDNASAAVQNEYYANWADRHLYGDTNANYCTPHTDKLYIDTTQNITYRWSGTTLIPIGNPFALGYTSTTAFPGDEGLQTKQALENLINNTIPEITSFVKYGKSIIQFDGILTESPDLQPASINYNPQTDSILYDAQRSTFIIAHSQNQNSDLTPLTYFGSASNAEFIGTLHNGQGLIPHPDKLYIDKNTSEIYLYSTDTSSLITLNTSTPQLLNSGTPPLIDVDQLCPIDKLGINNYYTLETAINAILAKQTDTGITYAKPNLIITYRSAPLTVLTWQFVGTLDSPDNFLDPDLWQPFNTTQAPPDIKIPQFNYDETTNALHITY